MSTDHHYKYHCTIPWFNLSVSGTGQVTHGCCDFAFSGIPLESLDSLDINALWNHQWFAEQRRIFKGESLKGTGCEWCRNTGIMKPVSYQIPEELNEEQTENFAAALQSFHNREEHVDHYPVNYIFDLGRMCNINCKMCLQKDTLGKEKSRFNAQQILRQTDILAKADTTALYGGEPTFIPAGRELLTALLTDPKLNNVELKLSTNGQLLDDFIPMLPGKKRLDLIISVDAYGKAYEAIRKGAKWDRLESNLKALLQMRSREVAFGAIQERDWSIEINAVMMKSTLAGLDDYSAWCVDFGVAPRFNMLFPTRTTHDEDVINSPSLLSEVPNWEGIMQKAIERFENAGFEQSAQQLRTCRDHYNEAAANQDAFSSESENEQLKMRLVALERKGELEGKKVLVWGTGSYYNISVAPELVKRADILEHIGFIDNNPGVQGNRLDEKEIYSPDRLGELRPDIVIIASWHYDAIRKQLTELGFQGSIF